MPARLAGLLCAAATAAGVAGCSPAGAGRGGGEGELDLYVSVPLHGPAARHGRAIREGVELALRLESSRDTRGLTVRVRDDVRNGEWSPAAVADNARRATSDSAALGYVGELESGATRVSLPITNEASMLQVSPASTALDLVSPFPGSDDVPGLVQPSGERSFGRVIPDDEAQAAAGAWWARRMDPRDALVVSDGSRFGDTVAEEFAEEAAALGIPVEGPRGAAGRAPAVRPGRDLVYYGGVARGALSALRRIANQAPGATIMGTDALLLDPAFLHGAAAFESRLVLTASAQDPAQLPPPQGPEFVRRYRERYGRRPDPYAAYGYEAIAVLLDSIRRAEAVERTAVIDAFFDTAGRHSVLGTYSIDEVGNTTLDRLAGYRVREGRPAFDAALRAP